VKLTIHLHLVPRSRRVELFFHFTIRGVALNYEHRDNFILSIWFMHYATSRKDASPSPDGVIDFFFLIYPILQAALGPGVYSAYNRNEHQQQNEKFLGSRAQPVGKADKLTTICEPIA
jgi:hypothetical protein